MEIERKNGEKWFEELSKPDAMFGKLRFAYRYTNFHKKGLNVLEEDRYKCPLCSPDSTTTLPEAKFAQHLERHDKMNEKARVRAVLGSSMFQKPPPGQMGLAALGVPDVTAPTKKKRAPKKATP